MNSGTGVVFEVFVILVTLASYSLLIMNCFKYDYVKQKTVKNNSDYCSSQFEKCEDEMAYCYRNLSLIENLTEKLDVDFNICKQNLSDSAVYTLQLQNEITSKVQKHENQLSNYTQKLISIESVVSVKDSELFKCKIDLSSSKDNARKTENALTISNSRLKESAEQLKLLAPFIQFQGQYGTIVFNYENLKTISIISI